MWCIMILWFGVMFHKVPNCRGVGYPVHLALQHRMSACICLCLTLCLSGRENSAVSGALLLKQRSIIHPRITESHKLFKFSENRTGLCGIEFSIHLQCDSYCAEWEDREKRVCMFTLSVHESTCMWDRDVVRCFVCQCCLFCMSELEKSIYRERNEKLSEQHAFILLYWKACASLGEGLICLLDMYSSHILYMRLKLSEIIP